MTRDQLYSKLDTLKLSAEASARLYEAFKEDPGIVAASAEKLAQKVIRELSLMLGEIEFEELYKKKHDEEED